VNSVPESPSNPENTGVPIIEFVDNDFMAVRPALVARCGGMNEAGVLTRIHYRSQAEYRSAHTDEHGVRWWPATLQTISDETGLRIEQVRHVLKQLEGKGLIEVAAHALGGPQDRTKSYRVILDGEGDSTDGPGASGDSNTGDVLNTPDAPSIETSLEDTPPTPQGGVVALAGTDWFEWAWAFWPKKSDKKNARTKWRGAVKRCGHTEQELANAVRAFGEAYALAVNDVTLVPALTVWLNGDRWNDPLPVPRAAGGGRGARASADDIVAMGRQMDAALGLGLTQ
jgi:hypothetical protein